MRKQIIEEIKQLARPEMKEMQSRIVNSNYPVLGSRVGDMRKIARKYSKDLSILDEMESEVYEEILIRGFIIAYNQTSILEKIDLILDYLKLVDSWALVDSFCSTFKIKEKEKPELFEFLKDCLKSQDEFIQRFALIMLLSHYIKFDKDKKLNRPKEVTKEDLIVKRNSSWLHLILEVVDKPYSTYYAQMGVAWLLAEAFLFFPKEILEFLKTNNLDDKSQNFTIDKIRQSRNPSKELKELVKDFKRDFK